MMNTNRAGHHRRLLIALTAGAVVGATLLAPGVARAAVPAFVQGKAFTTGTRVASTQVGAGPVGAGDLLVGWFAQYNAAGQVQVSDSVNGTWTRAPAGTAFQNDTGDIALYYLANSKAAATGLTVTVTAGAPAYFQGTVAEYSGVAVGGPLAQIVSNRGVGTAVDTGPTAAVGAGALVYSAVVTGGNPQSVAPGSSQGAPYVARSSTSSGSAYEQDISASNAGSQRGTATLGTSTDWYAVAAVFLPASSGDTQPPTTPTGLHATSVATTSVSLAWSPSTDNVGVTGYTVYRNGSAIGTTGSTTSYSDSTVSGGTGYTYAVDAFDAAGNHSARSTALAVTTPNSSPRFVQGAADSPGTRSTSTTLTLSGPVAAGDLLAGWFAQYDSPGQVQVSDNVNGAWTRSVSETFTNGGGDLAFFHLPNTKAAPQGLTITLSAAAATYLPGAAGEYAGVATSAPLKQAVVARGIGTTADSGATAAQSAGQLVIGGLITGGQPLTVTPGSSQGVPFALQVHNGSESADLAGILASAAGTQHAPFTLATGSDWYALCAVFQSG
ncbi:fibronectin type III domain-containing protein [Amycolatopsis panacis]|uniref:Fibronectin type III domain-containing protein n=1 Tax=Amycolatopsis panacis TaxID=2340917 RepID=A0A419I4Q8_9PSEU|nr:fibronectin type III domain-containing protein [Amycolatopsis panacis]RJQ85484.1 fibronectin type III domain-containing protein [Amycolatopsis panacis]